MIKLPPSLKSTLFRKNEKLRSDKLINNIFWNSIARFGSAGLNFLVTLILMNVLNVVDYGEFVVFFSIYSTIPYFFDFGLNNSVISIGAKLKTDSVQAYQDFISTFFSIKIVIVIAILLLSPIAAIFKILNGPIIYIIILGAALGVWECFLTIFKASQEFKFLSKLIPIRNFLALLGVLTLYYLFKVESWEIYLYFIMVIPLLMSLWIYYSHFKEIKIGIDVAMVRKIFMVSKWMALFTIVTAVHARADIYLLKYFGTIDKISDTEIGIFSAAFSLLALSNILTSTFSEAVLPKISEESSYEYFIQFINRIKRTILFVSLFAFILAFVLYFIFTWGFDGKYVNSINSMYFIGIGMILTFYIHTLSTIFYPLGRTDLLFKIILAMFIVNIALGYLLIPLWGAIGAAVTNCVVAAIGLVFTIFSLRKILRNERVRV